MADTSKSLTPLMRQYFAIKADYPDMILLFQVGDFYELFFEDAKTVAAFLGIALTKRGTNNGEPIPLCGVPVHALDHYLVKLVRGGFKVALCDQLTEPVPGKVVERGVTRVLTPGTLTDAKLLDEKSSSYIFSFFPTADQWGLLFGELLTAQLFATVLRPNAHKLLEAELSRFFPDEIVLPNTSMSKPFNSYFRNLGYFTTPIDFVEDEEFIGSARGWLGRQFKHEVTSSVYEHSGLRNAVYAFYGYLKKNQEGALTQFKSLRIYRPEDFLMLDSATQKNLELFKNSHDGSAHATLCNVMDGAVTAMGSRTIKKWITHPLVRREAIEQRLDVLSAFTRDIGCIQLLEKLLREVSDVERIVGRIALQRAPLHDYLHLKHSLSVIPAIKQELERHRDVVLVGIVLSKMYDTSPLYHFLHSALSDDSNYDRIIKTGFDADLDRMRELVNNSHTKILALEQEEQKLTGISSLKIRYNQIHGYYIEVTKTHFNAVPERYIRQQTLAGRERFLTPELRELQAEIIAARNQLSAHEEELFSRVKAAVKEQVSMLRSLAQALAHLDALLGLSRVAYEHGYVRPSFNDRREIIVEQGKHPVVAQVLGTSFIPNDTRITEAQSLLVITGPNMGGKSTYLRQVALICVMAQCGSFVPARAANLPLLDRIFTRIGAGDNVAGGKSTFLVEMEETAMICTQATRNSLVILDEVGRGTSTFDGLALAQAIIEYIFNIIGARCLFATHYHELTELSSKYTGIANYHAACKQTEQGILFLHTMVPGVADGSFGLEVAKLAALPQPIITRAQEILHFLPHAAPVTPQSLEVALHAQITKLEQELASKNKILSKVLAVDYDNLSPRKAFDLLWSLQKDT